MVPQAKLSYNLRLTGARDRMENVLESVVINFSSKVYSKSLLKG